MYLTAEAAPFSGNGIISEAGAALPAALRKLGHDVVVMSPAHGTIDRQRHKLTRVEDRVEVAVGERVEVALVERAEHDGLEYLFVRNDGFFDRPGIYGDEDWEFVDNAERFAFFVRASLLLLERRRLDPDVLHACEWPCALLPLYVARLLGAHHPLRRSACVLALQRLGDGGLFESNHFHDLGLARTASVEADLELFGRLSFVKAGLRHAHLSTLPSQRYIIEASSDDLGHGLEEVLRELGSRLRGVPNGVSTAEWNPAADRYLKSNYGSDDLIGRRSCKLDLQHELLLTPDLSSMVVAVVGQPSDARGTDLLLEVLPELVARGLQIAIVGGGDGSYGDRLANATRSHPGRIGWKADLTPLLEHKALAGSDALLVPSREEAWAPEVAKALRYGSVPIVRATGSLDDLIRESAADGRERNGFKFARYSAADLLGCVDRALACYRQGSEAWSSLVLSAMRQDVSWAASARQFADAYRDVLAITSARSRAGRIKPAARLRPAGSGRGHSGAGA